MPKAAPKKRQHYVDNKEFLAAIIKYKEKVEHAKDKGLAKPRVNDYIGGCFLKIATHLSYRPNFINYMILPNQEIHLHILHKLYTMHS